jgi:UDP-2,3-diacylglucosamine hydrolase
VRWLNSIQTDCQELFLLGDIFDFWFDYREVVPRGYVRLLGALANLADQGVIIHYFTGNHDMWIFDYLQKEIGLKVYYQPTTIERQGLKIHLGHGDGLGQGDRKYKIIKSILSNKFAQKLFSLLHPDIGLKLMKFASKQSRLAEKDQVMTSPENERLIQYSEQFLSTQKVDLFIFGHRHLAIDYTLSDGCSRYINLGEWWSICSFGKLEKGSFDLKFFEE